MLFGSAHTRKCVASGSARAADAQAIKPRQANRARTVRLNRAGIVKRAGGATCMKDILFAIGQKNPNAVMCGHSG
jgi:hypothetical protein